MREALFSVLGDVRGARVLDLYAGSGALGIEALSRGAERLVSVEAERNAVACIRANLTALGLDSRASVLAQPVSARSRCSSSTARSTSCSAIRRVDLPAAGSDLTRLVGAASWPPKPYRARARRS